MAETTIHFKPAESFFQQIVGFMPDLLKKAAEALAGLFGWASEQVGRLVGIFLNAYLIKVTGGEIVKTDVDVGKGTIRIVRVMRTHGVPAFILVLITILTIFAGLKWLRVDEAIIYYSPAKVSQLRTKELEELRKTIEELREAYEAGALTKEEFAKALEALSHAHSTS